MRVKHLPSASWLASVAALAWVGCSGADVDMPPAAEEHDPNAVSERTAEEQVEVAWVPGTPEPADTHIEGVEHNLVLDWIAQEDSIEALTANSRLIVRGEVESTRFDVIRAHSQVAGDDGYYDMPITIATVRVDEAVSPVDGMRTPSGDAVAAGTRVDVVFAGGLLSDGCTLEAEDNPLPRVGEQTVLFLDPYANDDVADQTQTPLATESLTGLYAVTGGPQGRVLLEDGIIRGSVAPHGAVAVDAFGGQPVGSLLERVREEADREYVPHDERDVTHDDSADHLRPKSLGGCGIVDWGVEWCRRPTNVTYADHAGSRWPVGTALHRWMYTHQWNSLYLHWQNGGSADVNVWENYYGYTGWYGYATYRSWNGCITSSVISLNNTYYAGSHHAMTTTVHEVGHTIGFGHAPSCSSIMYYDPTLCGAYPTYCDARAAATKYPY